MSEKADLGWTYGGKFYSVIGKTDKGRAVKKLVELFKKELGKVESIGVGDSPNDFPMLEVVDKPFLIGNKKSVISASLRVFMKYLMRFEGWFDENSYTGRREWNETLAFEQGRVSEAVY